MGQYDVNKAFETKLILATTATIITMLAVGSIKQDGLEDAIKLSLDKSSDFQDLVSLTERYSGLSSDSTLFQYILANNDSMGSNNKGVAINVNVDFPISTYSKMLEISDLKKLLSEPHRIEKDIVNLDLEITGEVIDSLDKAITFFKKNYQYFRNEPELLMNASLKAAGIPQLVSNELSGVFELDFVELLKSKSDEKDGRGK